MPFQVGQNIFTHADVVMKATPLEGPAANQPFTFKSCSKLEGKLNGKAISAMGNSIVPVAIAMASAEPSFSVGLDVAQEAIDYADHCGGQGYMRMGHNLVITATRPGLQPVTFKLITCFFENGFGLGSDTGAQLKDELSGKMRELLIRYKGRDMNPFTLPGGVNLT
jgi:hypothetical protein